MANQKKTNHNQSKEVLCNILDAVFKENLGTDEDPVYENSIFLKLEDADTGSVFTTNLSADAVQAITGLSRRMTNREMMHFAEVLREREDPVRLLIPKTAKIITPQMIKDSEKLDIVEEVDLADTPPVVEKYVDKFSIKKRKEN